MSNEKGEKQWCQFEHKPMIGSSIFYTITKSFVSPHRKRSLWTTIGIAYICFLGQSKGWFYFHGWKIEGIFPFTHSYYSPLECVWSCICSETISGLYNTSRTDKSKLKCCFSANYIINNSMDFPKLCYRCLQNPFHPEIFLLNCVCRLYYRRHH